MERMHGIVQRFAFLATKIPRVVIKNEVLLWSGTVRTRPIACGRWTALAIFKAEKGAAIRRWLQPVFILGVLIGGIGLSHAAFASTNYFYNGAQRVTISIPTDAFYVQEKPERSPTPIVQLFPEALFERSYAKGKYLLRFPNKPLGEPAQITAQLQEAGWNAFPLIYFSDTREDIKGQRPRMLLPRISVRLPETASLDNLLARFPVQKIEEVAYLPDTYILSPLSDAWLSALEVANALYESGLVVFATPWVTQRRVLRSIPDDPLFSSQWHLQNTAQNTGAVSGNDIDVVDAWDDATGSGVLIAITDDGLDQSHADLAAHVRADLGLDLVDDDNNPSAGDHGTACAGLAAAIGNNTLGIAGVAYNAALVGVRLFDLEYPVDDDEATAFQYGVTAENDADIIAINNNSWGPADDARRLEGPGPLAQAALEQGILQGRNGKGVIYVWAGGNGRSQGDNVNYDGYANSRYTIAVGASTDTGVYASYSEAGAALLLNAPSSGGNAGIVTTDFTGAAGYTSTDYEMDFGGTSASCPLVSGVVALLLETNPALTWRDVQHILLRSATKNDPTSDGWRTNGGGLLFHHDYGFGRVNAELAVKMAQSWTLVPAQEAAQEWEDAPAMPIPDNNAQGIVLHRSVITPARFVAEHVEVTVDISHPRRGDLEISLISPSGMESQLTRKHDDPNADFSNWSLMSVAHWGEAPNGIWTLRVCDQRGGNVGVLNAWRLSIHGYRSADTVHEGESAYHSADINQDGQISISELLRVIQLYNANEYGCDTGSEDGYAPNGLFRTCPPHYSDYAPANWRLELSELLRIVQFFNATGYEPCVESEDDFCPLL